MGTSGIYYHKLTHTADKYRSQYDDTAQGCLPLVLQDNAPNHSTYNSNRFAFVSLCSISWVKKHLMTPTRP